MRIPVHSPWLPGYMNVVQTVLVSLTMAGLFPDRPHILRMYTVLYFWNTLGFMLDDTFLFILRNLV